MAVTQATQLADFTSGIGTAGAILEVDNVSNRIGIGTTNPQALLQVGETIKMDGVTGVITATSFVGNVTGVATGLTGTPDITVGNIVAAGATFSGVVTYEDVTNVDSLGIVTARTGLEVTANGLVINAGVSTFAADLSMADKIVHTGDTNTAIRFPSADTFTVETSGVERLRVGSTGTVGVAGLSTATSFGAFNHLSAPFGGGTVSYTVTVASKTANHRYNGSGSSNGYLIDGVEAPFLTLTPGRTYRFVHDNTGSHPLKFYLEADKTTLYSTGVTFDNAYTEIVVSDSTPTILHYQCTNHGYMGNAVQVNSNISGGLVGTPDVAVTNINAGIATFTGAISATTGSFTGDVDIADKIVHTGDTNTAIRFPAADTFTVETSGSEAIRVDSSRRLLVGTNSAPAGTDAQYSKLAVRGNTLNSNACYLSLGNDKSTTNTTSDDNLGIITFNDNDSDAGEYARIIGASDGANATNDYPGKLTFSTTADGAASPTERLRITSAGQLLAGTTSTRTTGYQTNVGGQIHQELTNYGGITCFTNADSAEGTFFTLGKSRGTSAGAVTVVQADDRIGGINFQGTDGTDLHAVATIHAFVDGTPGNNDMPGRLVFSTTADGASSTTERLRITAAGLVRVPDNGKFTCGAGDDLAIYHDGTTSIITGDSSGDNISIRPKTGENGILLVPDGAVTLYHDDSAKLATTSTGVTVTGDVNSTSDIDLKKDIEVVTSATEMLNQLRGVKFTWKKNDEKSVGVIAQEVETILPELVKGEEGDKSVNYSGLVGVLIEAVKELSARVEELENR